MTTNFGRIGLEEIARRVAPVATIGPIASVSITDVVLDHRNTTPGALFCCIAGAHHDGHRFARAAAIGGAVAFICEHSLGDDALGLTQFIVAPGTAREAMARAACAFFGDPSLALSTVGVTGTNGKTTTTYLLRSILERHGWRTGVVGTLDGARTTPEAPDLQRALARQRDAGCRASTIEVTSHALVQHRVDGMIFDVGVFTNLSQDHLDFHKTMESYFEAKAGLFTKERIRCAIVNADDPYGRRLIENNEVPTMPFSLNDAKNLEIGLRESRFRLGGRNVRLRLGGEFNVRNALAAAASARALGVDVGSIVTGLDEASSVPGRFEAIESDAGFTVVVDYAHTPAGLGETLVAARAGALRGMHKNAGAKVPRVIVVFGCGGDRDRGKRPAMGAVASELADFVILSSDNPRSEDAGSIIEQIYAGISSRSHVEIEPDRRQAIFRALQAADREDVVIVAGKGHETTQQFSNSTTHFNDREVVEEELARLKRFQKVDLSNNHENLRK